ncbi:hypothetical protein, partial [[Ruminococcus] torques]|uniref:hypothetical protein n=1 Tax=[Ruminococcus] torques TaxID=33039 RepID=UPI00307788E6
VTVQPTPCVKRNVCVTWLMEDGVRERKDYGSDKRGAKHYVSGSAVSYQRCVCRRQQRGGWTNREII